MVTCPACGATIEADFGMVTCSSCENVFMVEIDGTIHAPAVETEEAHDPALEAAFSEEELAPSEETTVLVGAEDYSTETHEETVIEEPVAEDEIATAENSEYSEDFLDNMDGENPPPLDEAADPLGVTQFDGAQASQLVDGPFYYDVRVSGIDTASLKQHVIDMLSDKRLGWSTDEIKKKIKGGQLQLLNLNPVRAVLTVLQLQSLDVDVEWDQKPYTADMNAQKPKET